MANLTKYKAGDLVRIKAPADFQPWGGSESHWLAELDTIQIITSTSDTYETIYTFDFPEAHRVFGRPISLGEKWLQPCDACRCELCQIRRRDG